MSGTHLKLKLAILQSAAVWLLEAGVVRAQGLSPAATANVGSDNVAQVNDASDNVAPVNVAPISVTPVRRQLGTLIR